jgi:hypothetical protein
MPRGTAKSSQPTTMREGGVQDGFMGTNFQFKILDFFAHNAVEAGWKFELFTELKNAGKFDDVTLKVTGSDGVEQYIFGQAKYKKSPDYMKYAMLMTSSDYKLSYYFDSMKEVERNYKNIESVLLITNNMIDDGQYKMVENGLVKLPFNKHQTLYLIQDHSDHSIFKSIGKRFKFPSKEFPTEHQVVLDILRCDFVANDLIDLLMGDGKQKPVICLQNQKFLFEKIFDDSRVKFREEVFNGTEPSFDACRSAFEHAFKEALVKKNDADLKKWKKNCWDYWKQQSMAEKLKLIDTMDDADENQDKFDYEVERFMEKYVLIASLEVADIEECIKESMKDIYKMGDVSPQYQVLTDNVKDWYTGPNKAKPLTKEIYTKFFEKSELEHEKKVIVDLKKTLFKDFILEFRTINPDIKCFLDNTAVQKSDQILHVITPKSEESFTSMSIYSMLSSALKDSFVMLKSSLSNETVYQGLNVFRSDKSCNLLILQVDPECSLSEENCRNFLEVR